ncbi:MAG: glycosyltransferase family 4 protein, partial [Kiritimatiellota bacterium]|nr:glycosyltransferase family 4 protein [Kiritimatiellota bacterium]
AGKATPVTVIPNGVDGALFYPAPAGYNLGKMVLFVGRLVSNKGPEVLLRAIPLVLMRHPQARFVLAGDGPLRHRLEAVASKLAIKDVVHFLGLRRDVPELMRQASVYVRPSYLEGMPLTVLEAMASGLPVVATPVGGTPELLKDGVHGYLSPVGDPAALAAAISRVLDDPDGAAQMGRRGRELIESGYTWDAVVKQTERVYTEVLKQTRKESRAHE